MTKNSGKGGKSHKKMKNIQVTMKELLFAEDGQEYAIITDMLGSGRCLATTYSDKVSRLCIIRGNMRKKSVFFIRKGDTVLISLRDYQDNKADIIHLYNDDEVRSLKAYKEIVIEEENEESSIDFG